MLAIILLNFTFVIGTLLVCVEEIQSTIMYVIQVAVNSSLKTLVSNI